MEDLGIDYSDCFRVLRGFSPCCVGLCMDVWGESPIKALMGDLVDSSCGTPIEYGGFLDEYFWVDKKEWDFMSEFMGKNVKNGDFSND